MFEKESEEWEWIIELGGTEQYLGFWNVEAYSSIDEDEDYHPLGLGESLFLPNKYVEIKFKDITEPDRTDMTFRVKDDFLYVKGETDANVFSFGSEEYDRLYINADGIYDSDKDDKVLITTDKVEIGDSEIYLEMGSVKILDLTIKLDMSDILYKGISYLSEDGNFLDYFGIIFKDPENAVKDKTGFDVSVPEDRPEVSIAFGKDIPVEVVSDDEETTDTTTDGEDKDTTTTTDCPEEGTCEDCIKPDECKVCIKPVICTLPIDVEVGNLGAVIITAIIAVLAGGAGGVYFTRNKVLGKRGGLKVYRNNKGEEVTQHKHSSVRGYHDPSVSHRDEHERHPKGQLFPYYEKNIEKDRWEYVK